jgi:UDP-glucose 4-epimerase
MKKALAGEPLPVFGDGSQTRSFTFISEVAACLAETPFVAGARNQIFNVGADERMSVKDLAGHVCRILGVKENLVFLPARQEVMHAHADHSRVRSVFPEVFADCTAVVDGLAVMAAYLKSHPIPETTECPCDIEIMDRLPASWAERLEARLV